MIEILQPESFFQDRTNEMFYVGFLKSPDAWFPLCLVSDPEGKRELDSLVFSNSYQHMHEMLQSYSQQMSHVEDIFVQYLLPVEMQNLIERYGLNYIALISNDENQIDCTCGCSCS